LFSHDFPRAKTVPPSHAAFAKIEHRNSCTVKIPSADSEPASSAKNSYPGVKENRQRDWYSLGILGFFVNVNEDY